MLLYCRLGRGVSVCYRLSRGVFVYMKTVEMPTGGGLK